MNRLDSFAVGDTVKISEAGIPAEYLIVHKGLPSSLYDVSCDGVWLVRRDIKEKRAWHNSNVNDYENSDIHNYLNTTFLALFGRAIQEKIKQVKIPYRAGSGTSTTVSSGANGLSCKVFLLSCYEVGWSGFSNMPPDGVKLDYFSAGDTAEAKAKRVALRNNTAQSWYQRTPYSGSAIRCWYVTTEGGRGYADCSTTQSARPALILPADLSVLDDGTILVKDPPTAPGEITAQQGEDGGVTVTWTAATDPEGDALTYRVERSVNGGTWGLAAEETGLVWQDVVGYDWTTVQYRVQAVDDYGLTSDWTVGEALSVVYVLSLVTDRTARDVAQRTKKAFYNASDLIRVESAVAYIAQQLTAYGYPTTLVTKTDWEMGQIPKESQLIRYLNNVKKCLAQYCKQATTPEPPASMANLDYTGANTIEQILLDINLLLPQMAAVYRPSGTFNAGE